MAINNIVNLGSFIICTNNKLSEETKRKLLAIGIDPETVASEAEARVIIKNYEQNKAVQNIDNDSNSKNTCTAEQDLEEQKKTEKRIYEMLNQTANLNKFILGL